MGVNPASVGPPIDPATGVGNILPPSGSATVTEAPGVSGDASQIPEAALSTLDPGQALLDDIVIPQQVWPWADLGAFYTPETWLRMKRDVIGTVSQLVLQTSAGPKLVRGNPDGTLQVGASPTVATGNLLNPGSTVVIVVGDASYVNVAFTGANPILAHNSLLSFQGTTDGITWVDLPFESIQFSLAPVVLNPAQLTGGVGGTSLSGQFIVPVAGLLQMRVNLIGSAAGQLSLPVTVRTMVNENPPLPFNQQARANSLPVVLASDQSAVPISVGSPIDVSDRSARLLGHTTVDSVGGIVTEVPSRDGLTDSMLEITYLPLAAYTADAAAGVRNKTCRGARVRATVTVAGTGTLQLRLLAPAGEIWLYQSAITIGGAGEFEALFYPGVTVNAPGGAFTEFAAIPFPDGAQVYIRKTDASSWTFRVNVQLLN